jgi:precorrin-3B synthase
MRRGFCPGVWAPMLTGDGLLVRVRAPRGRLKANQIRGLAAAARTFGNGLLELTRRANLQLRGASDATLPDLQAELLRLGLASATPAAERQPALSLCPLEGLDPRCPPLEPLAEALEALLAEPVLTRPLSEKFALLVSGGSSLFNELPFDLHIEASRARPGWALVSVAGSLLGTCRHAAAPQLVRSLLMWLGTSVTEHARMRQLLDARGSAALAAALAPELEPAPRAEPFTAEYLGFHASTTPAPRGSARSWFGLELPFGALEAGDWDFVAELAERFGSGEIRLLATRALLLPDVREADAPALGQLARARRLGVRHQPHAPRLFACSGAPACGSAHGETRLLASELAALLEPHAGLTLHVSGCEKSCAWSGPADITLLHAPGGLRLGFSSSVAEIARSAPLSATAVREQIAARRAPQLATPSPRSLQNAGAP